MKIEQYIIKELQKKTKSKVSKNSTISDLEIDSLDLVEIVMLVEEQYDVIIPDDKLEGLREKTIIELLQLFNKAKK